MLTAKATINVDTFPSSARLFAVNVDIRKGAKVGVLITMVLLVIALLGVLSFFLHMSADSFNKKIDEINCASNCQFSASLFLGVNRVGFFFDTERKKICFLSGDKWEIIDFNYILSWQLSWDERPNNPIARFQNILFTFTTNDLKRPIIKIKQFNKNAADEWNAKLELLLS